MSGSGREGQLRGLGKQVPSPRGRRRPSAWASTITRRQASSLSSSCDVCLLPPPDVGAPGVNGIGPPVLGPQTRPGTHTGSSPGSPAADGRRWHVAAPMTVRANSYKTSPDIPVSPAGPVSLTNAVSYGASVRIKQNVYQVQAMGAGEAALSPAEGCRGPGEGPPEG